MVNETAAIDLCWLWRPPYGDTITAIRPMTEPITDKILVSRAANGDSIAFAELVRRHYRRAVRVSYGLLKNTEDAEDVVQDAFARVHIRLADFEGTSSFYTWLYRIVVNLSIDLLRRYRRERRADLDTANAQEAQAIQNELWPRYNDSHPGETSERHQLRQQLTEALADLPEIHQAVLLLRELEGMSYDQIADILSIKKGTVMSRLFHARKGMQAKLIETCVVDSKNLPEQSR
ncbi:MAG: sigma-70 family RNA polymerase sigma factor [Deltaproteobacteria bacterium]|nr:sigma-70 family RNA polymerase sigma factor [Deltaproteobacteria bacterium]